MSFAHYIWQDASFEYCRYLLATYHIDNVQIYVAHNFIRYCHIWFLRPINRNTNNDSKRNGLTILSIDLMYFETSSPLFIWFWYINWRLQHEQIITWQRNSLQILRLNCFRLAKIILLCYYVLLNLVKRWNFIGMSSKFEYRFQKYI